jgi:hypothetical protein
MIGDTRWVLTALSVQLDSVGSAVGMECLAHSAEHETDMNGMTVGC